MFPLLLHNTASSLLLSPRPSSSSAHPPLQMKEKDAAAAAHEIAAVANATKAAREAERALEGKIAKEIQVGRRPTTTLSFSLRQQSSSASAAIA